MSSRVVIATSERCSCNMLTSGLNSHPDVRLTGVAFGGRDITVTPYHFGYHLEVLVAGLLPTFGGFILHPFHPTALLARYQNLVGKLVVDRRVRLIDLRRKSLLRGYPFYPIREKMVCSSQWRTNTLPRLNTGLKRHRRIFSGVRSSTGQHVTHKPRSRTITVYVEQMNLDKIGTFLGLESPLMPPHTAYTIAATLRRRSRIISSSAKRGQTPLEHTLR